MPLVYLALGSNLGDRPANLRVALEQLLQNNGIRLQRVSRVYENRAVGMGKAGDFLNAVAELQVTVAPEALLELCLDVEQALGRERCGGWAPRTIDLDLVHYEGVSCESERLVLPHPRLAERDFVLVPLADLVPDLELGGRTVASLVGDLTVDAMRATGHSLDPGTSTE